MAQQPHTTPANIYPCLFYDDAAAAIEFLERAFGFKRRFVMPGPDGAIMHAELTYGDGVIMLGSSKAEEGWLSPRSLKGVNQLLSVRVDDPDAHYAQAKVAGAVITRELKDEEYGSRGYMAKDLEGNYWCFATYSPGAYWEK